MAERPYNSTGHNDGPKGSHGVGPDGLQHAHVKLDVLCLDCIAPVRGEFRLLVEVDVMIDAALLGDLGLLICDIGRLRLHRRLGDFR